MHRTFPKIFLSVHYFKRYNSCSVHELIHWIAYYALSFTEESMISDIKKNVSLFLSLACFIFLPFLCAQAPADLSCSPAKTSKDHPFPDWCSDMRIWPFDVLNPGMSRFDIENQVEQADSHQCNTVIFYMEPEHMYGTFVDETGFTAMLQEIIILTAKTKNLGMHSIVYVNGLEVMTRGAFNASCQSTGIPTMANTHPDWLQLDLNGSPIVYTCIQAAWLEKDWEDAWLSPYSGYRDFFKGRIQQLAGAGVDAVYIDAVFLPGFQRDEENLVWGTTDQGFAQAFKNATGLDLPADEEFDTDTFRAFLTFRHTALADYLGELAQTAWDSGLVPFFESSANDTPEGTTLGNETAVTGRCGLGFSPEIEPEGDWMAAYRMAKSARELNMNRPMIFLGWPENANAALMEYSITMCQSNNYYPTADISYPSNAFSFMDETHSIMSQRIPYPCHTALIYSVRNKDFTFENESFFQAYTAAFSWLESHHIPFRIIPLEYIQEEDTSQIEYIVLPGIQAVSDAEAAILTTKKAILSGENPASRDENWRLRTEPVSFSHTVNLLDIAPNLPFTVSAPEQTWIEFFINKNQPSCYDLFIFSEQPEGNLILTSSGNELNVISHSLNASQTQTRGESVQIALNSSLMVVQVQLPASQAPQIRLVPHLTSSSGGFSTAVFFQNITDHTVTASLTPFNATGYSLPTSTQTIDTGQTLKFLSSQLFNDSEDITHFQMNNTADEILVTVSYKASSGQSSPAHLGDSFVQARGWRLFPGDWNVVFDGVAIVNTGLVTAEIRIRQVSYEGQILQTETLASALGPMAKTLYVIGAPQGSVFQARNDTFFEIISSENCAITCLRGTPPGISPSLLWENAAVPFSP